MIYLKHSDHGAHHVYSESEALEAEKRGWVRAVWPPEAADAAKAPATGEAPKNKGGRPPKNKAA